MFGHDKKTAAGVSFEKGSRPRFLVTGAYGQLGSELCRLLGSAAVAVDIDDLDLTDGKAVRAMLGDSQPEVVINCAAYTQVDQAENDEDAARAVNAVAVKHLARACGEIDSLLVQISTDYVFGGSGDRTSPYREDEPPFPQCVYARTKREGELAASRHPKHLIVRTCGLYARPTDERANNFVRTMLRLGRSHGELRVVSDQQCTPSFVPHVAGAVLYLAGIAGCKPAPWGIYHVTNHGATNWHDFAVELFRLAGMRVSVEAISTAEYGAVAPRPAYSVLDTTAYDRLGGPAMPSWESALAEYVEQWKKAVA